MAMHLLKADAAEQGIDVTTEAGLKKVASGEYTPTRKAGRQVEALMDAIKHARKHPTGKAAKDLLQDVQDPLLWKQVKTGRSARLASYADDRGGRTKKGGK